MKRIPPYSHARGGNEESAITLVGERNEKEKNEKSTFEEIFHQSQWVESIGKK